MKPPQKKPKDDASAVPMDDILRRMLASPPDPHKKPAPKPAEKKPAK